MNQKPRPDLYRLFSKEERSWRGSGSKVAMLLYKRTESEKAKIYNFIYEKYSLIPLSNRIEFLFLSFFFHFLARFFEVTPIDCQSRDYDTDRETRGGGEGGDK